MNTNWRNKPDAPWVKERDLLIWRHAGLLCHMQRMPALGHWCGYVHIPAGHPLFGAGYANVDVSVHGGLTYADAGQDNDWVFGFDCAHYRDLTPALSGDGGVYRTQPWVKGETERLAEQLALRGEP